MICDRNDIKTYLQNIRHSTIHNDNHDDHDRELFCVEQHPPSDKLMNTPPLSWSVLMCSRRFKLCST